MAGANNGAEELPDAGGSDDIAASIEIFGGAEGVMLLIAGDLFGPFATSDEAIDAIPASLRSTF